MRRTNATHRQARRTRGADRSSAPNARRRLARRPTGLDAPNADTDATGPPASGSGPGPGRPRAEAPPARVMSLRPDLMRGAASDRTASRMIGAKAGWLSGCGGWRSIAFTDREGANQKTAPPAAARPAVRPRCRALPSPVPSLIQAVWVAGQPAQDVAKTMSGRAGKQGASTYRGEKPPNLAPPSAHSPPSRGPPKRGQQRRSDASTVTRTPRAESGSAGVAVDVTQGGNKGRHGKAIHRNPGPGNPPDTAHQPRPRPRTTNRLHPNTQAHKHHPTTARSSQHPTNHPTAHSPYRHHLAAAPLHPTAQLHFRTTHRENIW